MGQRKLPAARVRRVLDSDWFGRAIVFAIFAVAWQVWAAQQHSLLIPTFTATVVALFNLVQRPELWSALVISNQAMVIGFALAFTIGLPLGLAMGRYRRFGQIASPYLSILLVLPSAAFIPLVVIALGLELAARTFLITLFGVVIIVVTCRAGARQIDPSLIEMARSFGATERQVWSRVLIPASTPAIMVAARVGLARAVEGMVVVEILLASVGIGGLISRYGEIFDADYEYATILVLVLESLVLSIAASFVERRLTAWAPRASLRRTGAAR